MSKVEKSKMPKWAIILIVVGSIAIALPIIGIIGFFIYLGITDEIREDNIESNLKVGNEVTADYIKSEKTYVISGYLKNNDDDDYYGVYVEYSLYDEDGNIIGIATANLDKLSEGEVWRFSAEYTGNNAKDVVKYKLTQVNGDDEMY